MQQYKKYLYENVPVPRRTLYRRRIEAQRSAAAAEGNSSESDGEPVAGEPAAAINVNVADFENIDLSEHTEAEAESEVASESGVSASETSRSGAEDPDGPNSDEDLSNNDSDHRENPLYPEHHVEENRGGYPPPPNEDIPINNGGNRGLLLGDHLCGCTDTTEGDAFLMCLALGIRHSMTWIAMVDILKMINNLFGREVIHSTKYYLTKHFDVSKNSTTVHIYCSSCENYLGTKEHVAEEQVVQCNSCSAAVQPFSKLSSYFVSVDLEQQLKDLMEKPDVAEEIMNYRFNRRKVNANAREDVFDGNLYKNLLEEGQPLSNPLNFSVTINTDGIATGLSSAQSAWPIFLHVNELAPENRKKHMLYAGMWVGAKQPNMRLFLNKFVHNLHSLFSDGFTWTDIHGNIQNSKVFPLMAVLDSAARFKFLNLTSYSGYFGCTFCYQRAVNTVRGRRFTVANEVAPLRTQDSMIEDMRIAHANRNNEIRKLRVHRGCKGFTPLVMCSPYLDLGRGVVVDYMHNGLTGVTRNHVMSMLQTPNTPFYIGDPLNLFVMDQRLTKIRPPSSITRTPRELNQVKLYKASEWRSFLLFYGLICFNGILDRKYMEHFAMLSCAFYILLQSSIMDEELDLCNIYLRQYVYLTQEYFGVTSMTYNIHLLLHVAQAVADWGPIRAFSTFIFEGENHFLAKMKTSPGRMALQLTRRYLTFKSYPKLCETFASSDVPLNFIKEITGKSYNSFVRCNDALLVGKGKNYNLSEEEQECFRRNNLVFENVPVLSFEQILMKKLRFTTNRFCEGTKNDDSWIKDQQGRRGYITGIYYVNGEKIIIIVRKVKIDRALFLNSERVKVRHIQKIEREDPLIAIEPTDIIGQCIHTGTTERFIMDIPYGCYGD